MKGKDGENISQVLLLRLLHGIDTAQTQICGYVSFASHFKSSHVVLATCPETTEHRRVAREKIVLPQIQAYHPSIRLFW